MNVLVYDVAAGESGALTVLKDFYKEVSECNNKQIKWIFVVSTPEFSNSNNIKVLRYPWVKKSWLHRIYFERFVGPKLVKTNDAGIVFSLQNMIVSHTRVHQILYVQQSLPFVSYKFKPFQNSLLWIYQNIIGKKIIRSIRKSDKVIVQTQWMKQACVKKSGVSESKITVISPRIDLQGIEKYMDTPENKKVFFYPAAPFEYKNHRLIFEACKQLQQNNILDYQVIFTITGQENRYAKSLLDNGKKEDLNISFSGPLIRQAVFSLYSRAVLLFPSYIETFGFPMLEARTVGTIVLASDMPFSHEILEGYNNAFFYRFDDAETLAGYMKECIEGKITCNNETEKLSFQNKQRIVDFLLQEIER